jgi:uncharacterized protein GlcG (DUF336 family)
MAAEKLAVKKSLNLEVAKQIAAAAEREAKKNNWTVVIALVDDGGHLVLLERIDDTQYASVAVATKKAQTAVGFKRPTKSFEESIKGGRTVQLKLDAMPLEGGLPLVVDGKIVGAIGVSGMTSAQDGVVAKAGADALAEILRG